MIKFLIFIICVCNSTYILALDLASKVTVVTTCSPCISYPDTIFLQITQASMKRYIPEFDSLPKIIVCDGCRYESDREAYEGYKRNLERLVAYHPHFQNTKLVFCNEWLCLVGALKEALKQVETEYMFIHQDDFEVLLPINLHGLIQAMDKNAYIKSVRLNNGINCLGKSNPCDQYIDDYVEGGSDFPLLRTNGWGDCEHFTRKDYYDNFIFPLIGDEKTFMEARLMGYAAKAFKKNPDSHIKIYGTYLYGNFNEGPYCTHLDRKSKLWSGH